jgi:hypothetical protein
MSGSGSGAGFGGGVTDDDISCEALVIATHLISPKENVIAQIAVNTLLEVGVETKDNKIHVVVSHKGHVAGNIVSTQVQRLRECIQGGTKYVAKVVSINEGDVRVRISASKD